MAGAGASAFPGWREGPRGCLAASICEDPGMRWCTLLSSSVAALGAFACARGGETVPPSADLLLLEVGGAHSSLREALVASGVEVAAPKWLRERANASPEPTEQAPAGGSDESGGGPEQASAPVADHIVVALGRGQTLIHLAKKHLGNGNRFREILARNGWTEAEARRLPEGQLVKIPVETSAPRRR